MSALKIETRKTRLLRHIYIKLLESNLRDSYDTGDFYPEWLEVLDALKDVTESNEWGMKEWTVTKNYELKFK